MWIAFIFQYLWDTKQHFHIHQNNLYSCELLSFFSIFGIQNNVTSTSKVRNIVVNCFHFSVSLGYKTTLLQILSYRFRLWIAFIFQYLWDTKQLTDTKGYMMQGCELLSFFSIFGIQNNSYHLHSLTIRVVNCFHFSVSLGYKTTEQFSYAEKEVLWIAFIFQYLWDTKQLLLLMPC